MCVPQASTRIWDYPLPSLDSQRTRMLEAASGRSTWVARWGLGRVRTGRARQGLESGDTRPANPRATCVAVATQESLKTQEASLGVVVCGGSRQQEEGPQRQLDHPILDFCFPSKHSIGSGPPRSALDSGQSGL